MLLNSDYRWGKVIKVGVLHFMDMLLLPEHHTSVDQQLCAVLFIHCIVKKEKKKKESLAICEVRGEKAELPLLGCTGT